MSVLHWIGNPWDVPVGLTIMRGGGIGMIFVPKEFCSEWDRFDNPDVVRSRSERPEPLSVLTIEANDRGSWARDL